MRFPESLSRIDALGSARPKFFEPSFCLRYPQPFNVAFNLIVETGNQTLSKPHPIPQGEFHGISRDFIKGCVHCGFPPRSFL